MQNTAKSGLQSFKGGAKKRDEKNMAKEDGKFTGNHTNGYAAKPQSLPNFDKLEKNFYKEKEVVTKRSESDNAEYLKKNFIKVTGENCPRPVITFDDIELPKHVHAKIKE
jgi:hypothetical protein